MLKVLRREGMPSDSENARAAFLPRVNLHRIFHGSTYDRFVAMVQFIKIIDFGKQGNVQFFGQDSIIKRHIEFSE